MYDIMKRILLFIATLLCAISAMATGLDNAQKPLYILNGKVIEAEEFNTISSDDIESMTIIRDEERLRKLDSFGDTSNGVIVVTLKSEADNDEVFIHADIMPSFMSGDIRTFQNWVMESIRYPQKAIESGIEDNIIVSFTVNREGYIAAESIKILQSRHAILADEVKRVITSSPRWTPAIQAGQNVAVQFTMPVIFQLSDKDKNSAQPTESKANDNSKVVLQDKEVMVRALNETKPTDKSPTLYIIDGKPCTYEEFKTLPATEIKMITIVKDENNLLRYYRDFGDTSNGVVFIHTESNDPRVESDPDTLPTFFGKEISTFQTWVIENTRYPNQLIDQRLSAHIVAKCIINNMGFIEVMELNTIKGTPHQLFDEEVRRVMLSAPRWQPATKDGKTVAFEITLPIIFGAME